MSLPEQELSNVKLWNLVDIIVMTDRQYTCIQAYMMETYLFKDGRH